MVFAWLVSTPTVSTLIPMDSATPVRIIDAPTATILRLATVTPVLEDTLQLVAPASQSVPNNPVRPAVPPTPVNAVSACLATTSTSCLPSVSNVITLPSA